MGIYKIKGSPYWQYDFTVSGRRHRGSTETDSRKEAQAIHAELRSKAVKGKYSEEKDSLTLGQTMVRFEENHAMFLKSYDNSVRFHVDHLLRGFGKNTPFEKIGEAELQEYIASCRTETYKRGKNHKTFKASPATINRRLAIFKKVYNLARTTWKIQVQAINFKTLKLTEPEPPNNPLSRQEAETIMDAAPEHLKHFIMFSVYTGLRKSAVLSLGKNNIDMQNRRITTIGKSSKPGGKRIVVSIPDALYDHILEYELHTEDFCITHRDKPIRSISTSWRNLFKDTGISYRRPHDLRHTFATWLYQNTQDIRLVQERLHHASINTTMRYAHASENDDTRVNDALSLPEARQNAIRRVK